MSAKVKEGNLALSCAVLLSELVPITAVAGSVDKVFPACFGWKTTASLGSSRSKMAARAMPGGSWVGRSLRE